MNKARLLGALLLFVACVLFFLGMLEYLLSSGSVEAVLVANFYDILPVLIFGSSLLLFVVGFAVIEMAQREVDSEIMILWTSELQELLNGIRYPINAATFLPVGTFLADLYRQPCDWAMMIKMPGTLIREEIVRNRILQVVSSSDFDGRGIEAPMRDILDAGRSTWHEIIDLPGRKRRAEYWGKRLDVGDELAIVFCVLLPTDGVLLKQPRLYPVVYSAMLNLVLQRLAVILSNMIERRDNVSKEGIGLAIRILVHELAKELQGMYNCLAGLPTGDTVIKTQLAAIVQRTASWIDMFRDVPYFLDGWLPADPQATELDTVLTDVVDEAVRAWPDCSFSINMQGASHVQVQADRQLHVAIRNVVFNAASFTSIDGGDVKIVVDNHPAAYVYVFVEDDGPGVDPQEVSSIFDPGYSHNRPGRPGGMGIGLTIAREIIRTYGGEIKALSNQERDGGCFQILLPRPA